MTAKVFQGLSLPVAILRIIMLEELALSYDT